MHAVLDVNMSSYDDINDRYYIGLIFVDLKKKLSILSHETLRLKLRDWNP